MIFFPPLIIGFVFEVIASPRLGFYFLPALIMASVFYALPFVFPWLNILISFAASFLFSFVWMMLITEMRTPSFSYFVHIFIYLTVIAFSIFFAHAVQKK